MYRWFLVLRVVSLLLTMPLLDDSCRMESSRTGQCVLDCLPATSAPSSPK